MFLFGVKEIQLKIYYLFMLADGKITKNELDEYEKICNAMDVNTDEIMEIVNFCENAIHNTGNNNSEQVVKVISELNGLSRITYDKKIQTEVIWTLINLGYADTNYSDPEKQIVSFLIDSWELDAAIVADMYDTAETLLFLEKQKEWLKTTDKSFDIISSSIKKIDITIEQMFKNIEILISEADIA